MRTICRFRIRTFCVCAALLVANIAPFATAQTRRTDTQQSEDVLRINTELVQTDVMVFDKQGHFVNGLKPEDFDLQINSKTQSIAFFESVVAGSSSEASQLAAVRGSSAKSGKPDTQVDAEAGERGRVIFFLVDDLHLSSASLARSRQALQKFIDEGMNPSDQVAIVSTSGQVGFLQQLTDNQAVLSAAISRLNYKQNTEAYTGKTRISEYTANQILDYGNRELYAYLLESTKIEQQMGPGNRHGDHRPAASYSAAPYLKNRLRQASSQGRIDTQNTLLNLRRLILSSAELPGRKLIFMLSDGFTLNERKAGALDLFKEVTEAAMSAGAVVYTMDARGAIGGLGSGVDASTNDYVDFSARASALNGEIAATREPLKMIADETGGRAIFNSNSIDDGIREAINETSSYYLLAWRPDSTELRDARAQVKVLVKGHPELRVRVRVNRVNLARGDVSDKASAKPAGSERDDPKAGKNKDERANAEAKDVELVDALGGLYPSRQLPTAVSVGYVSTNDQGVVLRISMQLDRAIFDFDSATAPDKALVDVLGAAIDDRGSFASFKHVLTVTPESSTSGESKVVIWHQQLQVKPGLYQVRVAVRDRDSGRTGGASTWIEIPDLNKNGFTLSSLFLAERAASSETNAQVEEGPRPIIVDVDHRFARTSVLRFQTYVYNAARGTGSNLPDVTVQAQVLRNNSQVMGNASTIVPVSSDPSRMPFWSEIPLSQLPPGRYVLKVIATDRVSNRTTQQRVAFTVV